MTLPGDVTSCLKGPMEELMKFCSSEKLAALPDEEQPLAAPASEACQFRIALKMLDDKISMLAHQKIRADSDDKDDRHTDLLQHASENGFDMRDPLGQKFRRTDHYTSEQYAACTTQAAKRKFRQDWATGLWQEARVKRMKTESWQEVDETKGRYMPIRGIIKAEGDDDDAAVAATRYVDKGIKMAGKFISYNEMTERWEFLYFTRTLSTSFTKCWQIYCEQQPSSLLIEHTAETEACINVTAPTAKAKARAQAKSKPVTRERSRRNARNRSPQQRRARWNKQSLLG
jgi:hypothetical protein